MKVLIMHQTVARHDAIGNDIEMMYSILSKNYLCLVYAENQLNDNVKYINREELSSMLGDKELVVIYHHSVFWKVGEEILDHFYGKLIIRYHNITPPEFFEQYNEMHYQQCLKGREQTVRFVEKYPQAFWLADSEYNAKDLIGVPKKRIGICQPFHKIENWNKVHPDEEILKDLLESKEINLLFVGRVAPNKGHLFLLEILRVYLLNYDNNIKMRIIGKFDSNLEVYNQILKENIERYGLSKNIEFVGEINDATLASYYLGSDFFVCASEHEGFCVPILEAQSMGLPVIALDCAAVPDTGGEGQILLRKDARLFAAAIRVLSQQAESYQYMQNLGMDNFKNNHLHQHIAMKFEEQIERVMVE